MTTNPYEAPQTIELPTAEIVLPETISAARVAAALKELTQAGSCYCVGVYAGILMLILSYYYRLHASNHFDWLQTSGPTWIAMLAFFCLVVSIVFFGWGLLRQRRGCQALATDFPEASLKQLFAECRNASWRKAFLISSLLAIPVGAGRAYLVFSLPATGLWAWFTLISIYHHTQAFEFFARLLHQPRHTSKTLLFQVFGFIATMGTAILLVMNIAQFSQHQQEYYPGLLVVSLLWAVTLHLYVAEYRRLTDLFYKMI